MYGVFLNRLCIVFLLLLSWLLLLQQCSKLWECTATLGWINFEGELWFPYRKISSILVCFKVLPRWKVEFSLNMFTKNSIRSCSQCNFVTTAVGKLSHTSATFLFCFNMTFNLGKSFKVHKWTVFLWKILTCSRACLSYVFAAIGNSIKIC